MSDYKKLINETSVVGRVTLTSTQKEVLGFLLTALKISYIEKKEDGKLIGYKRLAMKCDGEHIVADMVKGKAGLIDLTIFKETLKWIRTGYQCNIEEVLKTNVYVYERKKRDYLYMSGSEYMLLKLLQDNFKYIGLNNDGSIYAYSEKPTKTKKGYELKDGVKHYIDCKAYNVAYKTLLTSENDLKEIEQVLKEYKED